MPVRIPQNVLHWYKTPFPDFPNELKVFYTLHSLTLPTIQTNIGQALSLLAQPDIRGRYYLERLDCQQFFRQIHFATNDAIQSFNKDFGGILRDMGRGMRGKYCLLFPFQKDTTDSDKRKGCVIEQDKEVGVNQIKNWWRKYLIDVPVESWQVGHLDPTIGDGSSSNLAYQPPIQAKYRNRFKWDAYFHKMWPTGDEYIRNMDTYHTKTEQLRILEVLKKKYP